jgi:hypothetical protein
MISSNLVNPSARICRAMEVPVTYSEVMDVPVTYSEVRQMGVTKR